MQPQYCASSLEQRHTVMTTRCYISLLMGRSPTQFPFSVLICAATFKRKPLYFPLINLQTQTSMTSDPSFRDPPQRVSL